LPVYSINVSSRPTKVVALDGNFDTVYPAGVDFSEFRDFAVLPDRSFVSKRAGQQGLPVEPDNLPKRLKWGHGELKKGIPDFEKYFGIFIASDNFRRVVERHEPGVHQFVPVEITWKNGGTSIPYYWLYPCNRFDSINDALTTFEARESEGRPKRWMHRPGGKLVFDLGKIGGTHMWLDRGYHSSDAIRISQTLKNAFEAAGLTGILYFEGEAV
jgi:hypothetical protein